MKINHDASKTKTGIFINETFSAVSVRLRTENFPWNFPERNGSDRTGQDRFRIEKGRENRPRTKRRHIRKLVKLKDRNRARLSTANFHL